MLHSDWSIQIQIFECCIPIGWFKFKYLNTVFSLVMFDQWEQKGNN